MHAQAGIQILGMAGERYLIILPFFAFLCFLLDHIERIQAFLTKYFVSCLEKNALTLSVYMECQPTE